MSDFDLFALGRVGYASWLWWISMFTFIYALAGVAVFRKPVDAARAIVTLAASLAGMTLAAFALGWLP